MLCHNCGQQNADDCVFCVYCGGKVESSDEQTLKVDAPGSSWKEEEVVSDFSNQKTIYPGSAPEDIPPPPPEPEEEKSYSSPPQEEKSYSPPPREEESYSPPPQESSSSPYSGSPGPDYGAEPPKNNTYAIISMVLAILSILCCCGSSFLGLLCTAPQILLNIIGLILGIMGKKQISNSDGTETGGVFAWIGIIGNLIFLLLAIAAIALVTLGLAASFLMPFAIEGSNY